jgi:LysM repeat protein
MKRLRLCLIFSLVAAMLFWAAPVGAAPPDHGQTQQIIHVVQPGENLFRIALRYGTTVGAIVAANGLTNARTIYAGQRLVIPRGSGSSATAGHPTTTYGTYVVRRGDTLSQIARRFGTTTATLARLNSIANPSAIYAGQVLRLPGAAPASSGGGKRIVVNLSEQHLYAYEGGRLVYSFVASSGVAPTYTRTGEFRVQRKIPNAYGAAWNIWMPHWLGIYWAGSTENGIHALPILPNGQTLWAGYLGRPVSYGCVVLGTYEAQLLYNWAEIGTPVSIRY